MLRSHPLARDVSRHVTELPGEFEVQRLGERWVVAGPTGIFAVGRTDGDVAGDAARLSLLAHEVRSTLSEMIPWVPFVDSLLVVHPEHLGDVPPASLACTVVELPMLTVALANGARTIGSEELQELYRLLPLVISRLQHGDPGPLAPA